MRKLLHTIGNRECLTSKLNCRFEQSNVQLSLSIVLVFFGWFFILPTNVCSYAYVLADSFHVKESLFILLSNCAGLLGLVVGGLQVVFTKNIKMLLLYVLSVLSLFNILIFVVPAQFGLILMISVYIMLGMYTALATYLFYINTLHFRRYIFTGSILAFIVFTTAFFKQGSEGVSATSVFTMNLVISLVVLTFIIVLNLVKEQPQKFAKAPNADKSVMGVFLLLCFYTFIMSFSLGFLSYESNFILSKSEPLSSVLNVVPYIGTMILIFSLPMKRYNMRIITYIANALMIISIALTDILSNRIDISGLFNVMQYFAIAINHLFIFDTTMELSGETKNPSIPISVGLLIFVLGSSIGDHVSDMLLVVEIGIIDRLLITLIALASTILPLLQILLSMHSQTSIFRIDTGALVNFPAMENPDQSYGVEPVQNSDDIKIYPDIANYNTLTNREKEVLDLLIKGYPSEVICSTLFISINTLKRHVQNIYNKLNVHNRAELFRLLNSPRI